MSGYEILMLLAVVALLAIAAFFAVPRVMRSEERRVGKECRL